MGSLKTLTPQGALRLPTQLPPNSLLVRKPNKHGIPQPKSARASVPIMQYGQLIYFYSHLQTHQVVYSLTRHLNNRNSLEQIPFLGKKTVPARIRKDLWTPFAMVYFPSSHAGMAAYRKLREFRRLHETEYDRKDIMETKGRFKGSLLSIKDRGKVLMNQKANSVADLAAVLLQQERGPSTGRVLLAEKRLQRQERLERFKTKPKKQKHPVDVEKEMAGVEGVLVKWADITDARYAETWPEPVKHGVLQKSRHTAAFPIVKEVAEEDEDISMSDDRALESRGEVQRKPPLAFWGRVNTWLRSRWPRKG